MTSRRRERNAQRHNPQVVLLTAQLEASAHQGRNGTRRRLATAKAAYANRVVGTENPGQVA